MAAKKGTKEKEYSGKRSLYKIEGGRIQRLRKFCPKCGPGVFLAQHEGRLSCGSCSYTEFVSA